MKILYRLTSGISATKVLILRALRKLEARKCGRSHEGGRKLEFRKHMV